MRLASHCWPEVGAPLLLLPLGATEQHGPHLPLETDTIIAAAIADAVAVRHPYVMVAPPLPYGASGEHAGFPGTLSLGAAGLELAVVELVRSAARVRGVIVVCWHGGNAEPLARAVHRLRGEGRTLAAWGPSLTGGDLHAGRTETSLMLALAPHLVGDARSAEATKPASELLPLLRKHGVKHCSRSGVLGDAAGATAREGNALLGELAGSLAALVHATMTVAAS